MQPVAHTSSPLAANITHGPATCAEYVGRIRVQDVIRCRATPRSNVQKTETVLRIHDPGIGPELGACIGEIKEANKTGQIGVSQTLAIEPYKESKLSASKREIDIALFA